jgi:hypothetical protein
MTLPIALVAPPHRPFQPARLDRVDACGAWPAALLEAARLARAFKVFFLRVTMFYQNPEQNILQDELS